MWTQLQHSQSSQNIRLNWTNVWINVAYLTQNLYQKCLREWRRFYRKYRMLGPDSICLNKTGHEAFLNEKLFLDNKSNVEYRNNHYLQIRKPGIVYYCLWQLWVRLISIQQCSLPRLHSQTWCLSSYLEIVSFFVCLFVFIFFSFSALSGCLYFLFLYKFCCQLLSKQIFLVSVFFCVPSLTVEGFLFCQISLIFIGVWQVLSFAFFSVL